MTCSPTTALALSVVAWRNAMGDRAAPSAYFGSAAGRCGWACGGKKRSMGLGSGAALGEGAGPFPAGTTFTVMPPRG